MYCIYDQGKFHSLKQKQKQKTWEIHYAASFQTREFWGRGKWPYIYKSRTLV